jgi:uncharacterized membrane protein
MTGSIRIKHRKNRNGVNPKNFLLKSFTFFGESLFLSVKLPFIFQHPLLVALIVLLIQQGVCPPIAEG